MSVNTSKKMMYDDMFFSVVLIVAGVFGLSGKHPYASEVAILFGAAWLGIRLFHLTHQNEVFCTDKELEPRLYNARIVADEAENDDESNLERLVMPDRMGSSINALLNCRCENKYSIEPHGKGYAIYFGRCPHRHGYNLAMITECSRKDIISHFEKCLNREA